MNNPDWRSASDYSDLQDCDAPQFAWQFLQRNPAFRKDWQALQHAADIGNLTQAKMDAFARKWGVRFHGERGFWTFIRTPLGRSRPAKHRCSCWHRGTPHRSQIPTGYGTTPWTILVAWRAELEPSGRRSPSLLAGRHHLFAWRAIAARLSFRSSLGCRKTALACAFR